MKACRTESLTSATSPTKNGSSPYLALVCEDAPQRTHDLREVFNALRWIVRAGASWPMLPHDFPPWDAVYQQTRRWIAAGPFEAMVHDLRALLRLASRRTPDPSAVTDIRSPSKMSIPTPVLVIDMCSTSRA